MTFLAPHFLWGLLAMLPLTAVYLLKVKPKVHRTNAFFLWEQVFEEKHSSSLFSKLRHLWSLLILLLVTLFIVLALAEPRFGKDETLDRIIVIDTSASMNTRDGGSSRIDKAKADAHALVRSLSGSQRALVATLDQALVLRTHLTRNSKELHEAIDSVRVSDMPVSKSAVKELVQVVSNSSGEDKAKVSLLSDGCGEFAALGDTSTMETISYYNEAKNIGIVAADIRSLPGDDSPAVCMVQLASAYSDVQEIELEIVHESTGAIGKLTKIKVKPGKNKAVFFRLNNVQAGKWQARVLEEDDFAQDNEVTMQLQPLRQIAISNLASDTYFYDRCIEAFSMSGGFVSTPPESASIFINAGAYKRQQGDVIHFAPTGDSPYWSNLGDEIPVDLVEETGKNHPVLRHVDINYLTFPGARRLQAPEGATVLLETHDGIPLIYLVNEANATTVVVNLDPAQGDFVLSPWFPVMIYDVASYLDGSTESLKSLYATGSKVPIELTSTGTLHDPAGNKKSITGGAGAMMIASGSYELKTPKHSHVLTASLLSIPDSAQSNQLKEVEGTKAKAPMSLSFWLIVAALALLILESILYHRRKVG